MSSNQEPSQINPDDQPHQDINDADADFAVDPDAGPVAESTDADQPDYNQLLDERDQLLERLQRVSADYHNFMKRSATNHETALDLMRGDILKSLIPLIDQFDHALTSEPQAPEAKGLYHGMSILKDEFVKILSQWDVQLIQPQIGDAFDPHQHEAMLRQEADGVQPNHIAMVLQPGYRYKQRTLRAAKVAVVPGDE